MGNMASQPEQVQAGAPQATALGGFNWTESSNRHWTVVGPGTERVGGGSRGTVVGARCSVHGSRNIVIGNDNHVEGDGNIVIGHGHVVHASGQVALGGCLTPLGVAPDLPAVTVLLAHIRAAMGNGCCVSEGHSLGCDTNVCGAHACAVGALNTVDAAGAVVFGTGNLVTKRDALVIGHDLHVPPQQAATVLLGDKRDDTEPNLAGLEGLLKCVLLDVYHAAMAHALMKPRAFL